MGKGRVLVTGLSGFTGRYVELALKAEGFDVVDLSAFKPRFNLTNLLDLEKCIASITFDYVIHLAAISFVAHGNATDFYEVNTIGTINLLEAIARSGQSVGKVIIASSANVYGNNKNSPIKEEAVPQPVNHYACSKLAMEHLVAQWFDRLPIVMVRPFNYTGRGQSLNFLVPKIVSHFILRKPQLELGNLDVVRDFSDVRTVSAIYAQLLTASVQSEIINICSGNGQTLEWIIDECARLTNYRPEIVVNPAFVRANEVKSLIGSSDKLSSIIGIQQTYTCSETLAWMLEV